MEYTYIVTVDQEDDDGPVLTAAEIEQVLLDSEQVQNASGVRVSARVTPFSVRLVIRK
jgi:hypothetical protein